MTTPARPRVSILLPCRDAEPFLPECIASLEAQTEPQYEVLTLDDGSSDCTREQLVAWAERDPRVRLLEPEGSGLVAALQRLARDARAGLLARMDADDIAAPGRLAVQLALLRDQPQIAACGTGVRYFPRPAAESGYLRYETWINGLRSPADLGRDVFVECPIAHPTLMVRRWVFEKIGGYRDVDGPEDYDLVLRLAEADHQIANVAEVLHEWRLGPHRISEQSERYSSDAFRRLKISFLRRSFVPEGRPLVMWGAGKVGKAFARAWLGSGGAPVRAFVDLDPRKIGQTIHGAPVIEPADLGEIAESELDRGGRPYVLAAVGSPGARQEIRDALEAMDFRELQDFRAVA